LIKSASVSPDPSKFNKVALMGRLVSISVLKNPGKKQPMGFPNAKEAERFLKTVFKYTDKEIAELVGNEAKEELQKAASIKKLILSQRLLKVANDIEDIKDIKKNLEESGNEDFFTKANKLQNFGVKNVYGKIIVYYKKPVPDSAKTTRWEYDRDTKELIPLKD